VIAKLLGVSKQANGEVSQVGVTVKSNAPEGSFSSGITIFLKGGDIKEITVPVDGYINADVFFTPAMISANNLKAGVVSSYDVTLQSPMNRSFAITDWQTNNPAIEVNAQRNERSSVQHITVKVRAPEKGTPNGRIIFTLDDGRQINLDVGNVAG